MRSLAQKIRSHANAWRHLPHLRSLTLQNHSIEQIIEGAFTYADGFLWPDQVWEEILETARTVAALRPLRVLEIGTDAGGTLLMWSRLAHPEASIISIDLPGGQTGSRASNLRMPLFRRMALPRQRIHLIRADSHAAATLAETQRILAGHQLDFLYIDGDHSEHGVRADYEMYGPLVLPGGLIAIHDIAVDSPTCGVGKFWRDLCQSRPTRSIIASPPKYGMGLLEIAGTKQPPRTPAA